MKIGRRTKRNFFATMAASFAGGASWRMSLRDEAHASGMADGHASYEVRHSEGAWRRRLSAEQYRVLRRGATEPPFASALLKERRDGVYACGGCGLPLFSSVTKFDSGTGWPSFWKPLDGAVATRDPSATGTLHNEVHCRRCGGHLGHVFDDGPAPTGLRYCLNGTALVFRESAL